jgi:ribulose-5-phosphate 4-epimerase/fuculose-1-phosphate aldolase
MGNNFQDLLKSKPQNLNSTHEAPENVALDVIGNEYTKIRLITSKDKQLGLKEWIQTNVDFINMLFEKDRILLFKGFASLGQKIDLSEIVGMTSKGKPLNYTEPSTPRTKVNDEIYTSTEYPKEQKIAQHNEHSYSDFWPKKVFFYCEKPSIVGGHTPIADSRSVYKLIPEKITKKFESKGGVMYVRNFSNEMDINWDVFFGTSVKSEVEQYCEKKNIKWQWGEDNKLRIFQISQAILNDKTLNVKNWFNQAHLFHYSNLNKEISDYLIETYGMENLPRNTYYADGSEIKEKDLNEIRHAYEKAMFRFDWEEGDLIMIDNVNFTHGRDPFQGDRSILVSMSEEDSIENYLDNNLINDVLTNQVDSSTNNVNTARKNTSAYFLKDDTVENSIEMLKYKLALSCRLLRMLDLDEGSISGHISMRVPNSDNLFWVNPFGVLFEEVTPDNLILVNENGDVLEGDYPINVAGFCIHSTIHKMYKDINCVVHTHSPWGTLFSSMKDCKILPIDQNSCMFFDNHVVYDQFEGPVNSIESADNLAKAIDGNNVAILSNHGILTCGQEMETALMFAVCLERAMRLNIKAKSFKDEIKLIDSQIARETKEWISNPIGFKIEFDALARKAERFYPDLLKYSPKNK